MNFAIILKISNNRNEEAFFIFNCISKI